MLYSTIKVVHDNEYRRGIKLIVVMHKICLIERFILHKNSVRLGKRLLKKNNEISSVFTCIFLFLPETIWIFGLEVFSLYLENV